MEVVFSEKLTPSGDVQMELDVGGVTRQVTLRPVPDRTFSNLLMLDYRVQEGDTDTDGTGIGTNSLKLNGSGIPNSAGNAAGLSHDTVSANSGQKVDTSSQD